MFSKFLSSKNESELAAMEMQWRMEFAKASRKFRNKKTGKQKRGRPAVSKLAAGMFANMKISEDLTKVANSLATTRDGRRLHHQVAENIAKRNEKKTDCKKKVCL